MASDIPKQDLGVLLTMLYVATTDGHLAGEEVSSLEAEVADLGLDVDVQKLIMDALHYPPTPVDLARRVPDPERRRDALRAASAAALADGTVVQAELRALERLAMAFEVPREDLAAIQEEARRWVDERGLHESYAEQLRRRFRDGLQPE